MGDTRISYEQHYTAKKKLIITRGHPLFRRLRDIVECFLGRRLSGGGRVVEAEWWRPSGGG